MISRASRLLGILLLLLLSSTSAQAQFIMRQFATGTVLPALPCRAADGFLRTGGSPGVFVCVSGAWVQVGTMAGGGAVWGAITGTLSDQTDLQAELDAKQATLVSATNIKTINGSSLLGAGDLTISSAVAWGAITGTLSDQTDLQAELDAKADGTGTANGTNTGDQTSIVGITGSLAEFNTALTGADFASGGGTATGTNTGDQTSIVGISGSLAEFNAALTGADFATGGGTVTGTSSNTNTGDQTITLTSDVTGTGTGSFATTIANSAVTLAKMADMATASLIYRKTAGTGAPEVNTLATVKTDLALVKGDVGLGNVDNTADASKVVLSAATLTTPRTINGTSFNGSANITVTAAADTLTGTTLAALSGVNLTALNATQLTSGTIPDARFPATLPAASGVNLTALNATQLTSGTVPDARFPATLPAASGINLTALNASNLGSGTVPTARLGSGTANGTTFLRGDSTWAAPTAAVSVSETEVDFGATPKYTYTFAITDAAVGTGSKLLITQSGAAATGRDADENDMDKLSCNATPAAGSFTLNCASLQGPVAGKYKVLYTIG
jgi:hypothetical protein